MTLFYNEPKDSKFATVAITDWTAVNSNVDFDELRFASNDEFYFVYMHATKFTDVIKIGDKDWKWTPQLVMIEVARKDVEKWNPKEKKKILTAQSSTEKLVCKMLDDLDSTLCYKGTMVLQESNFNLAILTGKDAQGKDIPEAMIEMLLAPLFNFDLVEESSLIPVDDVKVKERKAWSGGKAGQTELEKLNDRFTFIKEQLKLNGYQHDITSIGDLVSSGVIDNPVIVAFTQLFK